MKVNGHENVTSKDSCYKCEMLPLEIKQSGGKLLTHSDLGVGLRVSRGNTSQIQLNVWKN
jgi:hypothetical protein